MGLKVVPRLLCGPALGRVQSIEHGGAAYVVVLRLVGESEEVRIQSRWKDRDGRPTIVEVSHLSREELAGSIDTTADDSAATEEQPG